MTAKNTVKVLIDGKIITLGGFESDEYLQKIAAYLNSKIEELSTLPKYSRMSAETRQTLLSLNVADDYFNAKKQASIVDQELQKKDEDLYEFKQELVSVKMKNAELMEKFNESERKKAELEDLIRRLERKVVEMPE
ncbi:MAG: cell division protein ZapA [Lachnospiraceae bacterium]